MHRCFTLLFGLVCFLFSDAQTVSGLVKDAASGELLQGVTVFISGTTKGTTTDAEGAFLLKNVVFPCELSVSMVGFERQGFFLEAAPVKPMEVSLKEREVQIKSVQVQAKSNRAKNVNDFLEDFLGVGEARMGAILSNDEVLFFNIDKKVRSQSGLRIERKIKTEVRANELLNVKAAQLGYDLLVDLKYFENKHSHRWMNGDTISYFGYYYFKPFPTITKRMLKNRAKVYYNSRLHFLRALSQKKLALNGYVVSEVESDKGKKKYKPFDLEAALFKDDQGNTILRGLKGRQFVLLYYGKKNKPRNLEKKKPRGAFQQSPLYILEEEVLITPDGTNPYNQILFGGSIGQKGVGAMLPLDYYPPSTY